MAINRIHSRKRFLLFTLTRDGSGVRDMGSPVQGSCHTILVPLQSRGVEKFCVEAGARESGKGGDNRDNVGAWDSKR